MSPPLVVERVTIGPQGAFAKVPGVDVRYRLFTKVFPFGRGKIVEREGSRRSLAPRSVTSLDEALRSHLAFRR